MQQLSLPLDMPNFSFDQGTWFEQILTSLNISRGSAWPDKLGQSMRQWLREKSHSPIKTLSLFSGGGGLDIAFHDCGFDIVQMVELEAKYIQTLDKNSQPGKCLENSQTLCIDIRQFSPNPNLKVDLIIGGPPCQTFSAAGRRAAGVSGTSEARGTLFKEYIRLLKILQPKGFLFENVYGIIGAQKGEAWREIQKAFKEAGYTIYYRILDAADYGVPQHRERLFIVGLKQGHYLFPSPTHGPDSPGQEPFYSAGEAVAGTDLLETELGISGRYGHLLADIPPGLNYSFYTEEMGHPNPIFSWRSKFSDFLYKADPEMPVRTLKAQGGQYTGPFSWENRRFTIAELKRLQTFPDDYEIVGNRSVCIEQIGNSVPPQLGRMLALSILEQVMGVELPFSMHYLSPTQQLGFRQRKRQLTERYARKAKEAMPKRLGEDAYALLTSSAEPYSILSQSSGISQSNVRFLSNNFAWNDTKMPNSIEIHLKYELNSEYWAIAAQLGELEKDEPEYLIEIVPASGREEWGLGTEKVKLYARNLDPRVFTALWKAFEEKLHEITGKADLVQLSGYYQYKPRIRGNLTFHPHLKVTSFWRVVQGVVGGLGVAKQLKEEEIAILWNIQVKEVFSFLQSLRSMGYEVRNQNTNPQIFQGEYLIPYAFPTLTPRSVQLRKKLGKVDE